MNINIGGRKLKEETLEINCILYLHQAIREIRAILEDTRHKNRDTMALNKILKDLEFIFEQNSEVVQP